jgi:hypothetical protein
MMDRILYFAYGHNTNMQDMHKRCPAASAIGRAKVADYHLVFKKYLDIKHSPGDSVQGLLWKLPVKEIDNLDFNEDYGRHYTHDIVTVTYNGREYKALTYTALDGRWERLRPHQKHYISIVKQGYEHIGLPINQLKDAVYQNND